MIWYLQTLQCDHHNKTSCHLSSCKLSQYCELYSPQLFTYPPQLCITKYLHIPVGMKIETNTHLDIDTADTWCIRADLHSHLSRLRTPPLNQTHIQTNPDNHRNSYTDTHADTHKFTHAWTSTHMHITGTNTCMHVRIHTYTHIHCLMRGFIHNNPPKQLVPTSWFLNIIIKWKEPEILGEMTVLSRARSRKT